MHGDGHFRYGNLHFGFPLLQKLNDQSKDRKCGRETGQLHVGQDIIRNTLILPVVECNKVHLRMNKYFHLMPLYASTISEVNIARFTPLHYLSGFRFWFLQIKILCKPI